jgi:hypothetical protein
MADIQETLRKIGQYAADAELALIEAAVEKDGVKKEDGFTYIQMTEPWRKIYDAINQIDSYASAAEAEDEGQ